MSSPRSLKCKHSFCLEYIQTALNVCNRCPVCQQPQGVITGNQPRGQMTFYTDRNGVPGYEGKTSLKPEFKQQICIAASQVSENESDFTH